MSVLTSIAGSIVMALLVQGPANLQLSEVKTVPPPNVIPKGTRIPIQLQTKLKLSRIESQCRLTKGRQRNGSWSESIVRHPIVRAIEQIEPFGQKVDRDSLVETDASAEAHVQ